MTQLDEFRKFLEEQALSDKTVKTYVNAIARLPDDPMKLFARPALSPSSRHTYRAALVQWANFTEDDDLLEELNSAATRRKMTKMRRGTTRSRKRVEPFTKEQIDAIQEVLDEWDEDDDTPRWVQPALSVLIKFGLRAGVDLVWLERKRLVEALDTGTLEIITKGSKLRKLPVSIARDELENLVEIKGWKYLAEVISPYASTDKRGDAAYQAVSRKLKSAALEAGIDPSEVHTHRFRHSAANRLMDKTGDELLVRDFLGHSSVATTHKYLGRDRTADIARALEED